MKYTINNEKLSLKKAIDVLMEIPVENFSRFLTKESIYIRKCDIVEILRAKASKISKVVKKNNMQKYMSDEYFRRLEFFYYFSLYQLMFFVDNYDLDFKFEKFQREIYKFVLTSYPNIEIDTTGTKENEHLISFLNKIKSNMVDLKGQIDGVSMESTDQSLTKGTTLSEVRKVAEFCMIDLQRRIKKTELQELIIFGATRRDIQFTVEELEVLEQGSNIKLETLATDHHIPAKIELTKDGIYEYLLMKHEMQIVEKADYITVYTSRFKKIRIKNKFDASFKTRKETNETYLKNLEHQKTEAVKEKLIGENTSSEMNGLTTDTPRKSRKEKERDLSRSKKVYAVFRVEKNRTVDEDNIHTKVERQSVLTQEATTEVTTEL